jgi:cardiolipin synthase C
MGKRKICKIVFVILSIFLCVAFYELFGICIAYKKQPEVSNTIKKETQNDSLTWITAKYFQPIRKAFGY